MHAPSFWYPEHTERGPRLSLAARALGPLGWIYDGAGRAKRFLTRPVKPAVPVVCIGNLTVGGTGKTPLALTLARQLKAMGMKPVFLTRGYGGRYRGPLRVDPETHTARHVGDEPLLLATTATTIVARRRPAGARLAVEEGADIILMDDGYQNPSLHKTMNLLVLDGEMLFGNEQVVPAGPLRERILSGMNRADALIVMGGTNAEPVVHQRLDHLLQGFARPIFKAHLAPDPERLQHLLGRRYVAFAGIGRPAKFFGTAHELGLDLAAQRAFPDHHVFTEDELTSLDKDARRHGALLLTTEKDAMRLSPERRARVAVLPVHVNFENTNGFWSFFKDHLDTAVSLDHPADDVGEDAGRERQSPPVSSVVEARPSR